MLAREIRTNNSKVKLAFGGVFASLTEMQRGQPVQSPNCAMERQLDQWPNGKHEQAAGGMNQTGLQRRAVPMLLHRV